MINNIIRAVKTLYFTKQSE